MYHLLHGLCLITCLTFTNGMLLPADMDCQLSPWSEYSQDPNNSQLLVRTRTILVHPRGRGKLCTGELTQTARAQEHATPTLSKFLSEFIPGDQRKVNLGGRLLGRGQVPRGYVFKRDIMIVIDTTVYEFVLPLYKSLLSNLVAAVCGDIGYAPRKNIFSLITYDRSRTDVLHSFKDPQIKSKIQNKILSIAAPKPGNGNSSLLLNAMRLAQRQISGLDTGTRGYNVAHKDVVLFVTYRTVCSPETRQASQRIRIYGRLYVVVLGESGDGTTPPNGWCLAQFASPKFDSHFLWLKSYDDLREFSSWALEISSVLNPCYPNSPHTAMEV